MKIILGTMNFGPQLNLSQSREMVDEFLLLGNKEIDTAYVYNGGQTEEYLGDILPHLKQSSFQIATKVHPRITGCLDKECIEMEFYESLKRMNLDKVDLLYFHFPDKVTPLDEAIKTIGEIFKKGEINDFGLSNYPAWMIVEAINLCDKYGVPRPTVYQGMYNAICRNVEGELFDVVRRYGMRFYAFNPLAGGLLTGKHLKVEDIPQSGRFARLESYRKRYWKKNYFEAIEVIKTECDREKISMAEVAYRWLINHSMLSEVNGDGILLGASSITQMRDNLEFSKKGPLSQTILEALDEAWQIARHDSPSYYKFIN